MRLTVFLILISVFCVFAGESYSQTKKLTIKVENAKVEDVLANIEKQSEFYFFIYSEKVIDVDRKVSLDIKDENIKTVLNTLFAGTNVAYSVDDRLIILSTPELIRNKNQAVWQQTTVSGKVTDAEGQPLPGASIVVKGTTQGSVTNADGEYTLTGLPADAVLVFSFVGMKTQEVVVGRQGTINIRMEEETIGIEEVVAIGYGTQKRINITGSVSAVTSEELTKRPVSNPAIMLQGKVPGLQIIQSSGAPGNESASLQIRGQRSYGAGNEPLVMVDGIEGSFDEVDPDMIESISVLKDASSSAIYGSRAANGVILITTKRGKANNRLNIEYHYNFGIHNPTFLPELITNTAEYMTLLNEAMVNSRGAGMEQYTQEEINMYKNNVGDPMYPNTDWNKYTYRTGTQHDHYLSLNGGNETNNFNLGLGYIDQVGVIQQYDAEKYNILFNMTSKMSEIVTLSTNFLMSKNQRNESYGGVTNLVLTTWGAHPTYGPYILHGPNEGKYTRWGFSKVYNNWQPLIAIENGGDLYENKNAHISAKVNVRLMKELNWETTGTAKYYFGHFKRTGYSVPTYDWFTGEYVAHVQPTSTGIAVTRTDSKDHFYNLFSTLKYDKLFAEKHQVNALLGYSQESFRYEYLTGYRKKMPSPSATELDSGTSDGQSTGGSAHEWGIQSLFGRANYSYDNRYLFETSIRYDGSSRFSEGNKWGLFPSFSVGWRMNNESFMSDVAWIDEIKPRASWGKLGNQEIGNYPYQQIMSIGLNYPFGSSVQSGAYLGRLSNENITWETTTITDIGLDFAFFKNRLYGTLDYYNKYTTDILRSAQVPGLVGLSAPTINSGEMKNEGFEVFIGHKNKIGDFGYDLSFNLGHYKNTLTKFGERDEHSTYINEEGLPWNSYYTWHQIGIFQSQEEIDNAPVHMYNPEPGDFRYEDVNNDDKIDSKDKVVIPGKHPKYDYGANVSLTWKNFDLYAFFQGSEGRKYAVIFWGFEPFFQEGKPPTFWRNRWTPENPSTTLPRLYMPGEHPAITEFSSWWLQDASYLRLKNLQFGYNLPMTICSKIGFQSIRVYYSGDNLLTLTNYYKGITGSSNVGGDPERYAHGAKNWFANYPQVIIHSFGVKIQL